MSSFTRLWKSKIMKVFRYMWTTSSLDYTRESLYEDLKNNSVKNAVYLLALPENDLHVMDIYPSKILKQRYFRKSDQWIIGAAATKEEAEELGCSIINMVFQKTGKTDVKAYLRPVLEAGPEGRDA